MVIYKTKGDKSDSFVSNRFLLGLKEIKNDHDFQIEFIRTTELVI